MRSVSAPLIASHLGDVLFPIVGLELSWRQVLILVLGVSGDGLRVLLVEDRVELGEGSEVVSGSFGVDVVGGVGVVEAVVAGVGGHLGHVVGVRVVRLELRFVLLEVASTASLVEHPLLDFEFRVLAAARLGGVNGLVDFLLPQGLLLNRRVVRLHVVAVVLLSVLRCPFLVPIIVIILYYRLLISYFLLLLLDIVAQI